MKKTYEQWREIAIPHWRTVPSSGWNDPNEGWYYDWMKYRDSPNDHIEDVRIESARELLISKGWIPPNT